MMNLSPIVIVHNVNAVRAFELAGERQEHRHVIIFLWKDYLFHSFSSQLRFLGFFLQQFVETIRAEEPCV